MWFEANRLTASRRQRRVTKDNTGACGLPLNKERVGRPAHSENLGGDYIQS